MHKADATSNTNLSMANIPKSDIVFQRFKNLNNACLRRKQAGQNKGEKGKSPINIYDANLLIIRIYLAPIQILHISIEKRSYVVRYEAPRKSYGNGCGGLSSVPLVTTSRLPHLIYPIYSTQSR
jgi:hypothetical protein